MQIVRACEGESLNVLTDTVTVKLGAAQSARNMAVFVVDVPAASAVPPHTHGVEDESYFMLAGSLRMTVGGAEHRLRAGDFLHIPAGTVHGYCNDGPDPARFLAWTLGGPLDGFFREMSRRVRSLPEDAAALREVLARFGVTAVASQ